MPLEKESWHVKYDNMDNHDNNYFHYNSKTMLTKSINSETGLKAQNEMSCNKSIY